MRHHTPTARADTRAIPALVLPPTAQAPYPGIDTASEAAWHALPEVSALSVPVAHQVLWYGVEAVSHAVVLDQLTQALQQGTPVQEFARKMRFGDVDTRFQFPALTVPLQRIVELGVFVPTQALTVHGRERGERTISLFTADYLNIDRSKTAAAICGTVTTAIELYDAKVRSTAMRFVQGLWQAIEAGYKSFQDPKICGPVRPEEARAAEALLTYYREIVLASA